jgi:hypothetical protein
MMDTINHFSQKQRAMFFAESYRCYVLAGVSS